MKQSRRQTRRRTLKQKKTRKQRISRKQKAGGPGSPCPEKCPYGNGMHDMGHRMLSPILEDGRGGYFRKYTSYCSQCGCAKTQPFPVFPAGYDSRGRPLFTSE